MPPLQGTHFGVHAVLSLVRHEDRQLRSHAHRLLTGQAHPPCGPHRY